MTVERGYDETHDDRLFEDGEALVRLAQRAFETAARNAVLENDRLGIRTHGTVEGELVARAPTRRVASSGSS